MAVILAHSLDDALRALADHPDAMILAGGTDLLVALNEGHRTLPGNSTVISVDRAAELRSWTVDHRRGHVTIGAAVTYSELLAEPLASLIPALAEAARTVGSPQIRNAGTLGGNLGTCSPAGDGLPVLAALEATVHLASSSGTREVPVGEFMVGVKRTALQPGELITAVSIPLVEGWQGYAKVGVRNAMVIATASAALVADTAARRVRIALGSVGPTILRCPEAEEMLARVVDWSASAVAEEDLRAVGALVAAASRPIDDHRSTAAYRRHAVDVMVRRLARRAFPHDPTSPSITSHLGGATR